MVREYMTALNKIDPSIFMQFENDCHCLLGPDQEIIAKIMFMKSSKEVLQRLLVHKDLNNFFLLPPQICSLFSDLKVEPEA